MKLVDSIDIDILRFSFNVVLVLLIFYWLISTYGTSTLSYVVNKYLIWRHPIWSTDAKRKPIPTCPYVWPNGQGDVAKFLEGEENGNVWGRKFGGIYRLWSGTVGEVVVTDPGHIKNIFYDSDKHVKAFNNNSGWLMGELLGKCVGLISGANWSRVRSHTGAHFTHSAAAHQLSHVLRRTTRHIKNLCSSGALSVKGTSCLDPVQDLKYLPFWVVADLLYGEMSPAMETEMQELAELREKIWTRMIQGGLTRFAIACYLPWGPARELRVFKKRWEAFNRCARDASLASRQRTPIVDMFAAVDLGTLQLDELLQTCDEMLFANLDVTIGALSWNVVFLATHPAVQEQIRAEIAANTFDPADQAKYLQNSTTLLSASILEASRLRPLAPFSVPQAAPTDRHVGPYLVPAGTNFIVDTYKLNIQHQSWGADGRVYRPSRFLGAKASELRYAFWRFGFGPRQCLGKYVADVIIRSLLAELLVGWRLDFEGEQSDWAKKEGSWIMTPDVVVKCERIS